MKKGNVFSDIVKALFRPDKYGELLSVSTGRCIWYIVITVLFAAVFVVTETVVITHRQCIDFFNNTLPDFRYENNTLTVDKPLDLESDVFIIKASDTETFSEDELTDVYFGWLFGKDSVIFKNGETIQTVKYTELTPSDAVFAKSDCGRYINFYYLGLVSIAIFLIMSMFAMFLLNALLVALISSVINAFIHCPLGFGSLFKLSLYAKALPMILFTIFYFFGSQLAQWLQTGLAIAFMVYAMINLKKTLYPKKDDDSRIFPPFSDDDSNK